MLSPNYVSIRSLLDWLGRHICDLELEEVFYKEASLLLTTVSGDRKISRDSSDSIKNSWLKFQKSIQLSRCVSWAPQLYNLQKKREGGNFDSCSKIKNKDVYPLYLILQLALSDVDIFFLCYSSKSC